MSILVVGPILQEAWLREIRENGREKASLSRALARSFGAHYLLAAVCELVGKCIFGIMVAVTLGLLVEDLQALIVNLNSTGDNLEWSWTSLKAVIIYKSILLFLFLGGNILAAQYYLFYTTYVGMKCRIACTYLIYQKSLKISLLTLESATSGQIMNLITNDVNRFDVAFFYLQFIVVAPLHAFVIFTLLSINYLGFSSTSIGILLVAIYLFCQIFIGKTFGRLRLEANSKTDERVRLMGELLDSIGIIKMYAWEDYFYKVIDRIRDGELSILRKVDQLRVLNLSLFYGACKVVLMFIFIAYILFGNPFNSKKIFTAMTLTNSMRTYLTLFFPKSVAQAFEVHTSIERIRQFLVLDELPHINSSTMKPIDIARQALQSTSRPSISSISSRRSTVIRPIFSQDDNPKSNVQIPQNLPSEEIARFRAASGGPGVVASTIDIEQRKAPDSCSICAKYDYNRLLIDKKFAIIFHEVSAAWPKPNSGSSESGTERPQYSPKMFNNLTAHIKHHELVMIVGRVGTGKSSLLMSILNELPIQAGSISINGSLSYASQEPWLFAGTIRDNITIAWHRRAGKSKRLPHKLEQRYKEVIRVCGLERDLQVLKQGDQTMVGERGTGLSGGQRARVNLARALFYDADIYLLDDPLSAVDASVAKYIFEECFKTFLKRKTVLLVTHQVQFSTPAQKVLLLHDSPDFSYGPATQVLQRLFQKYKLDPKAAVSANENEERAVVPVPTITEDSQLTLSSIVPLGEIFSSSLSNTKSINSDELQFIAMNSDEIFGAYDSSPNSVLSRGADNPLPEANRAIKRLKASKSPSLRLLAEASVSYDPVQSASCDTYSYYMFKAATIWVMVLFVVLNIITQILFNGTDYYLSAWSKSQERLNINATTSVQLDSWDLLNIQYKCFFYLTIIGILLIASFARNMIFLRACFHASKIIHQETLDCVIHAPMSFFHKHSIGSILARFSTDLNSLDDFVPQAAIEVIEICTNVLGIVVITAFVNWYNIVPATILLLFVNYLRRINGRELGNMKNFEAKARGRAFSCVMSTLNGLTTIRVFRLESTIRKRFQTAQDEHTSAWFTFLSKQHSLTQSVDASSMVYFLILMTANLLMSFNGFIDASMIGLLVSQVIILPGPLQWGARQITDLQSYMSSVSRIREYTTLKREQNALPAPEFELPNRWPQLGSIKYEYITLTYSNGSHALNGVSFEVKAGEHVGIVGRTGAGKSSVIAALFRMADFDGNILIDNVDTKKISLKELRSSISIIPQEPVLFSGSIRHNLDPFNKYTDEAIWDALNSVQLKKIITELDGGLDSMVTEGGHNLSLGQRQLICLARAILRKNPILVLDEATANVDPETDAFIQSTIRTMFAKCTVLTIAHRLHTIMDSDRVLVLDSGRVREFDAPHSLLIRNTLLLTMVMNSGSDAETLKRIAEENFRKKQANIRIDRDIINKSLDQAKV